jgi:hypothetical protein
MPKPTQKFLSSKYAIGASTVSDIPKNADVLLGQYENNADGKGNDLIIHASLMNSTN